MVISVKWTIFDLISDSPLLDCFLHRNESNWSRKKNESMGRITEHKSKEERKWDYYIWGCNSLSILMCERRKKQTWIDLSIVRHSIRIDYVLEDFRVFVSHIVSRRNSLDEERTKDRKNEVEIPSIRFRSIQVWEDGHHTKNIDLSPILINLVI